MIEKIKEHIIKAKTRKESIDSSLQQRKKKVRILTKEMKNTEVAKLLLQEVAKKTQQELEFQVSEIVTLALEAVFTEDNYEFKIEFVIKRGKTEAELFLIRNREKYNILQDTGGGVVDVVTFALRIALWNLSTPKTRNTIVFDEPFTRLRGKELQSRAGIMLQEISKKLNIQFIIVSHEDVVIDSADKIFVVTQKNGVSKCQAKEK